MCPPEYYGIEYEINPWMNQARQANHELAVRQWTDLNDLLAGLGVTIEIVSPVRGLPDLVFTANAAVREVGWLSQGWAGWSINRSGYLSQEAFAYALARFAALKERADSKPWLPHMSPDIRSYFKRSVKFLRRKGSAS